VRKRAAVGVVIVLLVACSGGNGAKPISEQDCEELARTQVSVRDDTRPEKIPSIASSELEVGLRQTALGCTTTTVGPN